MLAGCPAQVASTDYSSDIGQKPAMGFEGVVFAVRGWCGRAAVQITEDTLLGSALDSGNAVSRGIYAVGHIQCHPQIPSGPDRDLCETISFPACF